MSFDEVESNDEQENELSFLYNINDLYFNYFIILVINIYYYTHLIFIKQIYINNYNSNY
jgi:hypothetical protein